MKKRAILDDVSVLIPAFNEEENIKGTLVSVLHNSVQPRQVIVIDDGSTDDTAHRVKELMLEYPVITLIQQANSGKARALNRGLQDISTKYFIAIDGDTVLDRHAIKHLMHHITGTTLAAVAGTVMPIHTRTWLEKFQYLEYVVSQSIEKNALAHVDAISVVPGPIGVWQTEAVRSVGGYCTDTMVEDQALTLALHVAKYSISYEVKAKAYTETPHTIDDFIKQRYRWTFGMLQCLWKFKSHFFSLKRLSLGYIIMPNAAIFSFLVTLLYPIMDVVLIIGLLLGQTSHIVTAYLLFTAFDLGYSLLAHKDLGKHKMLLVLLPLQRLFYRGVMYYVVLKSIISAIEGSRSKWNRVHKKGDAYAYLVQLFEKRGYRI
jgi:cellulose synthase/poly-beta-1,6-N-acetylglucosamine synthase-like glycosyltransferase